MSTTTTIKSKPRKPRFFSNFRDKFKKVKKNLKEKYMRTITYDELLLEWLRYTKYYKTNLEECEGKLKKLFDGRNNITDDSLIEELRRLRKDNEMLKEMNW